jgi:hypothetical protein
MERTLTIHPRTKQAFYRSLRSEESGERTFLLSRTLLEKQQSLTPDIIDRGFMTAKLSFVTAAYEAEKILKETLIDFGEYSGILSESSATALRCRRLGYQVLGVANGLGFTVLPSGITSPLTEKLVELYSPEFEYLQSQVMSGVVQEHAADVEARTEALADISQRPGLMKRFGDSMQALVAHEPPYAMHARGDYSEDKAENFELAASAITRAVDPIK